MERRDVRDDRARLYWRDGGVRPAICSLAFPDPPRQRGFKINQGTYRIRRGNVDEGTGSSVHHICAVHRINLYQ